MNSYITVFRDVQRTYYPLIRTVTFILISLTFSHFTTFAGSNNGTEADSTDLFSVVQGEYGPDQVVMNGSYPEDYPPDVIGHPFLQDKIFFPGYVVVHNRKFDHLFLKYNIFDQNIIVSLTATDNSPLKVIPPNTFISEFFLNGKLFRKFCFDGMNEKYYQVVYDGKIKCLFSFSKKRYESFHNSEHRSFKFSGDIKKSWLLIGQNLNPYKTLRSFLQYYPKKLRPEIKTYCRKKKLRLSKSNDQEIKQLMEFCENKIPGN